MKVLAILLLVLTAPAANADDQPFKARDFVISDDPPARVKYSVRHPRITKVGQFTTNVVIPIGNVVLDVATLLKR